MCSRSAVFPHMRLSKQVTQAEELLLDFVAHPDIHCAFLLVLQVTNAGLQAWVLYRLPLLLIVQSCTYCISLNRCCPQLVAALK